jgi:L-asparaginase
LFEAIKSAPEERIVVTHGTDTLIESAQHLQSRSELFFPKKKIVLTGSFLPQVFKDSDADFNVGSAIGFLQSDSFSNHLRLQETRVDYLSENKI